MEDFLEACPGERAASFTGVVSMVTCASTQKMMPIPEWAEGPWAPAAGRRTLEFNKVLVPWVVAYPAPQSIARLLLETAVCAANSQRQESRQVVGTQLQTPVEKDSGK